MGKNNKNKSTKEERYEKTDFSSLISHGKGHSAPPKYEATQNTRPAKKTYAPAVVPEEATRISDIFIDQINRVIEAILPADKLYNVGGFGVSVDGFADLKFYILDRLVRTDRESGVLTRASMTAVIVDGNNNIKYFASSYINKDLIASVTVTPIDENGPQYHNSARWSNRPPREN